MAKMFYASNTNAIHTALYSYSCTRTVLSLRQGIPHSINLKKPKYNLQTLFALCLKAYQKPSLSPNRHNYSIWLANAASSTSASNSCSTPFTCRYRCYSWTDKSKHRETERERERELNLNYKSSQQVQWGAEQFIKLKYKHVIRQHNSSVDMNSPT